MAAKVTARWARQKDAHPQMRFSLMTMKDTVSRWYTSGDDTTFEDAIAVMEMQA